MQNLFTQNVAKTNIRVAKFLNLKNENETKNKNLSVSIISIQYWCLSQTSKYLMHIAKNCRHYSSLENLDFSKTIWLFTTLYSFVWLKEKHWNYGSISTYPQWVLRGLENFIS